MRVYSWNTALTSVATIELGVDVNSIRWNQPGSFLEIGLTAAVQVRVYSFTGDTTLTPTDSETPDAQVNNMRWTPSANYLSCVGVANANTAFSCIFANRTGCTGCLIKDCTVSNATGESLLAAGISAYSLSSLAVSNTSFNNDNNYRLVNNYYTGGLFGAPTAIQNIGVPPT